MLVIVWRGNNSQFSCKVKNEHFYIVTSTLKGENPLTEGEMIEVYCDARQCHSNVLTTVSCLQDFTT